MVWGAVCVLFSMLLQTTMAETFSYTRVQYMGYTGCVYMCIKALFVVYITFSTFNVRY